MQYVWKKKIYKPFSTPYFSKKHTCKCCITICNSIMLFLKLFIKAGKEWSPPRTLKIGGDQRVNCSPDHAGDVMNQKFKFDDNAIRPVIAAHWRSCRNLLFTYVDPNKWANGAGVLTTTVQHQFVVHASNSRTVLDCGAVRILRIFQEDETRVPRN